MTTMVLTCKPEVQIATNDLDGKYMESLLLLIPISLILVGVIVWTLMWSIKSGQFEDLEGPAHQIIMDDDDIKPQKSQNESKPKEKG